MSAELTDAGDKEFSKKQQESALFVDDESKILSSIRRLIRPLKLQAYFAESGAEGLRILEEHEVDLVVSDMRMPEMDGAQFLAEVKKRWPKTVRVLLTGYADMASTIEALNKGGIYRYVSKPWEDEELRDIILDGIKLRRLERESAELTALTQKQNEELQDLNKNLEAKVLSRTEEIRQTSKMLDLAYKDLSESYDSFVRVFASFVEKREALQKGESQIVADFAKRIAQALKLKDEQVQAVYQASLLHQIGKLGFPDALLEKAEGDFSDQELEMYKQYPLVGEAALTAIHGFERAAILIRNHMEYVDGSGFPDGLKSDKTRAGARIIRAVRDFIGMQTGAMFSQKLTADDAFKYIEERAGSKYDKTVVKALKHFCKQYDISALYEDELKIQSHALQPGMRLTKDLVNSNDLLLIAKGIPLNKAVIEKIQLMERVENERYEIHVAKEFETSDTPEI